MMAELVGSILLGHMDINFTSFLDKRIQHYYCGFWVKTESNNS